MSPSALSIVLVTFRDGIKRSTALAYWALIASGGAGAGLLIGGLLTQYLGWQWNFFVNVPIGIIMSILIYRFVPLHEKEERNSGMDVSGALLITFSLMSVALGLSVAPLWGWGSMGTIGLFLFAAVTLGGFIWNEKHVRSPLIPLSIFRTRNLTGANLIMIPLYATVLGAFFLLSVFLQDHLSYRPLITGLAFLPFPIAIGFTSTRMPKLIAKYCYRPFLIGGPILVLAAYLWFTRMPLDASYLVDLLPAFLVMPIGVGLAMTPTYTAATSGVPDHETGLASGLITTSQQMGGALGLSALASIAASAGTVSFIHGYHVAFFAGTGFMVLAIAVAFFVIRNRCDEGTATEAGAML
jgi:predicted MFS family arabinose efflux permease